MAASKQNRYSRQTRLGVRPMGRLSGLTKPETMLRLVLGPQKDTA
jgi:hypothetical protein